MANDFGTNYVIGVTLENLAALKELRAELQALRADSKSPIDFKVNVKPNTADNIAKVVEDKVAQGIEKGTQKATRGKGGASGGGTVAFDPASLQKLDTMITKLVTALGSKGGLSGGGATVDAKIDPKAIADAVAAGVKEGLAGAGRQRGASTRTERRDVNDTRRAQLESELDALGGLPNVKEGTVVTERDAAKIRRLLKKRAEVIGGLFAKQTAELEKKIEAFAEMSGSTQGNISGAFGAEGQRIGRVDSGMEAYGEVTSRLVREQQKLLDDSTKLLNQRFSEISTALDKGYEEVSVRVKTTGLKDVNQQLRRSTLRLEKAFESVGNKIAQQLGQFTESLVDRISSLQLNVNASSLQQSVAAASEAAMPGSGRRRRVIKLPQADAVPELGPSILGDSPEAARGATIRNGLKMLEELREKERKRSAATKSSWEKNDSAFMSLPAAEARQIFDEGRRYNTYLNASHTDAVRSAFGSSFGEDAGGGGIRVSYRDAQALSQAARLRQAMDKGQVVDTSQVHSVMQNPVSRQLMEASPSDVLPMIEAQKVIGRMTKLSRFTRAELDAPRWSPVEFQMTEQHLRATGQVTDADEVRRRMDSMLKRAKHAGFEFTPYGKPEQGILLDEMQRASGLKEGMAFGKKVGGMFGPGGWNSKRQGVYYDNQGRLSQSPEEIISSVLGFGGEWHHGPFRGFANAALQPDIRDLAAGSPIIDYKGGPRDPNLDEVKRVFGHRAHSMGDVDIAAQFEKGRAWRSARTAAGAAVETAQMAAGGGGGGGVPPIPPASVGGSGPGGGGPGDWRDFAAAMKALENVRLTGLADDFKSMAQSMSEMRKNGGSQWQQWLRAAGANGRLGELNAKRDMQADRLASQDLRTDAMREKTAAWLNAQGLWGVNKMGQGLDQGVATLGAGTDVDGLHSFGLADRFMRLNGQLGSKQLRFDELLNTYGPGGGRDPRTITAMSRAAVEMDAKRQTMMDTVLAGGAKNPRLAALGGDVANYADVSKERMRAEDERKQILHDFNMSPKVPEEMRARIDGAMLKDLSARRMAEDQLANSILKRARAEFEAMQAAEKHGTWIERIANKTKSLAMYATAGGLVYGAYAAAQSGFSGAVGIERDAADIQGVVGNRTAAEREQVRRGVMQGAIDYGAPMSSSFATAKIFAQSGMGVDRTVSMTRSALAGQLGAGLDPHQSTEMLIAVDNITKGMVTASDVLDRISRVEAKYSVTAQDLSVAIQRVGSLATQLQPGRVGRLDAIDFVIGATTTQIQQTRAGGDQTANALKFMMSRLASPDIMNKMQETYGIKLAANKGGTELRPLFDIFNDISKTYKELQKKDEAKGSSSGLALQFLSTVAGQRQANQAAALFGNWDDVMKASTESARAWGDTQRRVNLQMDTFSFQMERTKNAFIAFTSEVLRSAGVLTLLKGGAHLLGSAADSTRDYAGVSPLVGGAALTGIGILARRGAMSGAIRAGTLAVEAGSVAVGSVVAANWGSLLTIASTVALRIGAILTGLGTVAAVIGGSVYLYNKLNEKSPLANPDLSEANLRGSDLYKGYEAYAQQNGTSVDGLQSRVFQAAARAKASVMSDSKYAGIKNDIFTTDDDRRKYAITLADDTTKRFTEELAKAVPSISSIADESERTAAALMLLKQSAQVGQMESSYVAGYQDEQLAGLTKKMQTEILGMSQKGLFGAHASDGFGSSTDTLVKDSLNKAFGVFGAQVTTTRLLDAHNKSATIVMQVAERMRQTGETFGQAFDQVSESALELSAEQAGLVEKLKHEKGMPSDPDAQRNALLARLGGMSGDTARGARHVLTNQRMLDNAIYDNMKSAIPLVENTVGGENQGGIKGSNLIFESIMRAGRRRVEDLRKAGMTGRARVMEELLTTAQRPENRAAYDMAIMRGGNYRATFRDRVLDQIIRYDQADTSAREGGGALRRIGITTDVTQERSAAANSLVRGLYDAKAQMNGDVLRASSQLAQFNDFQLEGFSADATGAGDSNDRSTIANKFLSSLQHMDPKEQQQLRMKLKIARKAAEQIASNDDMFKNLEGPEQLTIKKILAPGFNNTSLANQTLAFSQIVKMAERIAGVMDDQLTQEKLKLQKIEAAATLDNTILQLSQEEAKTRRSVLMRRRDTFGGQYASIDAQRKEFETAYQDALDTAASEARGKSGALNIRSGLYGGGFEVERAQIAAEQYLKGLTAKGARDRGLTDLNAAFTDYNEARRRDYTIRHEEIFGGPMARARTQLQWAPAGTPAAEEAMREYRLSLAGRYMSNYQQMTQGSLQGVRSSLTSYETFKGPALGARIIKPFADTMTNQVNNSFLSALTGPDGLFGNQLAKLFNSQFFLEADMIRNAHVTGITAGFAAVGMFGGGGIDMGSNGHGGISDASVGSVNVSRMSKGEALKQLALTGAIMGGNILGGTIGTKAGVNSGSNYGSEGAQLGSTFGAAIGMMTPLGPLGGAIGGALGGLVGGFFGGRFGKNNNQVPQFSALDRIDRNTRETVQAIENQTHMMALENRLLNVPANFRIPGYAVAGGGGPMAAFAAAGGTMQVQVNVTEAGSAQDTAMKVVDQMRAELRGTGSFVSPRGGRN